MNAALVIPCFNEAARLDAREVARLARRVDVVLVDDGSTDGTADVVRAIARDVPRVRALVLDANGGKAEAVRRGLVDALARGAAVVGFADADFSTSADELCRLLDVLVSRDVDVVLGSRVARLGADIERRATRHLGGRVFATLASWTLCAAVYDTQCGAKWFRATPALSAALATPFATRWAFDVELLGRLLGRMGDGPVVSPGRLLEVPLDAWHDRRGSKLGLSGKVRGMCEVAALFAVSRRPARPRSRPRGAGGG